MAGVVVPVRVTPIHVCVRVGAIVMGISMTDIVMCVGMRHVIVRVAMNAACCRVRVGVRVGAVCMIVLMPIAVSVQMGRVGMVICVRRVGVRIRVVTVVEVRIIVKTDRPGDEDHIAMRVELRFAPVRDVSVVVAVGRIDVWNVGVRAVRVAVAV